MVSFEKAAIAENLLLNHRCKNCEKSKIAFLTCNEVNLKMGEWSTPKYDTCKKWEEKK